MLTLFLLLIIIVIVVVIATSILIFHIQDGLIPGSQSSVFTLNIEIMYLGFKLNYFDLKYNLV